MLNRRPHRNYSYCVLFRFVISENFIPTSGTLLRSKGQKMKVNISFVCATRLSITLFSPSSSLLFTFFWPTLSGYPSSIRSTLPFFVQSPLLPSFLSSPSSPAFPTAPTSPHLKPGLLSGQLATSFATITDKFRSFIRYCLKPEPTPWSGQRTTRLRTATTAHIVSADVTTLWCLTTRGRLCVCRVAVQVCLIS